MKKNAKMMAIGVILAAVVMYSGVALAETASQVGSGSATANLGFTVTIPKFAYFSISVADVTFNPTYDGSGNLSTVTQNETVQVTYFSNDTTATIASSGTVAIEHATNGSTIPWTDFTLASDNAGLNPGTAVQFAGYTPALNGNFLTGYTNVGWTFTYTPSTNDLEGGDYTGNLQYTLTIP